MLLLLIVGNEKLQYLCLTVISNVTMVSHFRAETGTQICTQRDCVGTDLGGL